MRPRVFPAEDAPLSAVKRFRHMRFNEAAGIPRGRRYQGSIILRFALACFNEAAGIPRGRPSTPPWIANFAPRLQ